MNFANNSAHILSQEEMSNTPSCTESMESFTVKEEPQDSVPSVKIEENDENYFKFCNEDITSKIQIENKKMFISNETAKEEDYSENIEKTECDPLAVNDSDMDNIKKEYLDIKDIKEEITAEIYEEHKYKETIYDIDIVHRKVECNVDNDQTSVKSLPGTPPVIQVHAICNERSDQNSVCNENDRTLSSEEIKSATCSKCHKVFSTGRNLKRHYNSVHKGIKHECPECHKMFCNRRTLKTHIDRVHKGIKHECTECHIIFSKVSSLKSHTDSVHKGVKYECNECHKMFSAGHLKTHINIIHKGFKRECNECHQTFSCLSNLKTHIESMHKRIKHKCNECEKMFSRERRLKRHIEAVHKGMKFECSDCKRAFSDVRSIKAHIESIHKGIKQECNECHKMFSSVSSLRAHIDNIHKGKKYLKCYLCERMFCRRDFKNHIEIVHQKIKNY